jgi:hypothetical protein
MAARLQSKFQRQATAGHKWSCVGSFALDEEIKGFLSCQIGVHPLWVWLLATLVLFGRLMPHDSKVDGTNSHCSEVCDHKFERSSLRRSDIGHEQLERGSDKGHELHLIEFVHRLYLVSGKR